MVGNNFISYIDKEVTWTVYLIAKQTNSTTFLRCLKGQVSLGEIG